MQINDTPNPGKGAGFARAPQAGPLGRLLPLLGGVRQTGPDTYTASCPTARHRRGDRSRGLRIRERDDGALLLWCGAGCGAEEIAGAVGLNLADLFPQPDPGPDGTGRKPKVPPIPWRFMLAALETDLITCSLAFSDLAAGKEFSPADAAYIAMRSADLAAIVREVRHGGR